MRWSARAACTALLVPTLATGQGVPKLQQTGFQAPIPSGRALLRFDVTVPPNVRNEPLTGRVFVILASAETPEPRLQISRVGTPMFGKDAVRLLPGAVLSITGADLGHPVWDLADVLAGEYWIQAMVNVYSEFKRADGKVVWMHDDQWEGQQWNRSPGNLYSVPRKVTIDPMKKSVVQLTADQVLPPIPMPANTASVERFRFQSPLLSKFWGRPIYLGATVLLPRDYKTATINYPVLYEQGHFAIGPPLRYEENSELGREWMKDDFPRVLVVTFQHPAPYFDDSYAVNSVNVGPYGDALMKELIPEIEKRYRTIREPWARWLHGGSTGGWEALALQLQQPDFFGATWAYCPDPVTFSDVEGMNIYKDDNAFYKQVTPWHRTPTINSREINGEVRQTSQQRNWMELVNGTHGRSEQQLDIWSAVFGPLGDDGYFKPVFDKKTGAIDRSVAQYWKENYDLLYMLQKNWSTLGPKLVDKLHIYVGDADTYFLDRGTRELEAWMKTTQNPHYEGWFLYGDNKPHCWSGPESSAQRLRTMATHAMRHMPQGATTPWWKY